MVSCSIVLVGDHVAKTDLSVLSRDTPKHVVHRELGLPISIGYDQKLNEEFEVYLVRKGYDVNERSVRAWCHIVNDLATAFL